MCFAVEDGSQNVNETLSGGTGFLYAETTSETPSQSLEKNIGNQISNDQWLTSAKACSNPTSVAQFGTPIKLKYGYNSSMQLLKSAGFKFLGKRHTYAEEFRS